MDPMLGVGMLALAPAAGDFLPGAWVWMVRLGGSRWVEGSLLWFAWPGGEGSSRAAAASSWGKRSFAWPGGVGLAICCLP